jgi:hypothetical protein
VSVSFPQSLSPSDSLCASLTFLSLFLTPSISLLAALFLALSLGGDLGSDDGVLGAERAALERDGCVGEGGGGAPGYDPFAVHAPHSGMPLTEGYIGGCDQEWAIQGDVIKSYIGGCDQEGEIESPRER